MTASMPPRPGSVIRYAYLWANENAVGRDEGRKDRPALVARAGGNRHLRPVQIAT
jgi:hypothetical protein